MMKFTNILLGAMATTALASCADLDTEILDSYVTTDQKQRSEERRVGKEC